MIQWLRSLAYVAVMYLSMPALAVIFAIPAIASRRGAVLAAKSFARFNLWTAGWMVGLRTEVRGPVPDGEVMIAAKHQSFLDILMIYAAVPHARFIMKRELVYAPFFGQYALRIGCIPVDRGKRGKAIEKMLADVARGRDEPGQLVIYPQGTRVAPGRYLPYKIGSALIYRDLGQPCVPAATNVGVFWPRRGILRKPGLAVVEFLDPIPPGLEAKPFMAELENRVEAASDRLMAEAGFAPPASGA